MRMIELLKRGNRSSGLSALGNVAIAIIKGIAALISGSGAMFATMIHSIADSLNQGMVFFGSALAEKKPTKRFPTGYGRVVNLFVLLAVIVVSIMAYETILNGWHIIQDPQPSSNLWLMIIVMIISIAIDGGVLLKVMKEVVHEARAEKDGNFIVESFKNIKYAQPPTRLVFYEDNVATLGGAVALIAIAVSHMTGNYVYDGIGTMIIGILLIGIAIKIGYDNTIGLIGVAAPKKIETSVAQIILNDPKVVDIQKMRILQEGGDYHVEAYLELEKGMTLADADDVKFRVAEQILDQSYIDDVFLGIIESDDKQTWTDITLEKDDK
ncbi:cation diffusion facilitator family transporter [Allobacillus sp. GCM10007491]|uniref:Cation diffusion facilitator family transporter n=1 Tax=Allobacillus saliphilus TaxID=2912308 RepID=A0A941CVE0_9BACI|nr:cation diffusion facilitator family transporter [Allobacillus saliphilus]MBR7554687.1 cation diffusion facilitator family transporter [Allobacillus saliphilus]